MAGGGRRDADRPRTSPRRRARIYLLTPLALYNVALKVGRVVTQLDAPGPLGFLDQVRSEVLSGSA
jgi:hypothetical protein